MKLTYKPIKFHSASISYAVFVLPPTHYYQTNRSIPIDICIKKLLFQKNTRETLVPISSAVFPILMQNYKSIKNLPLFYKFLPASKKVQPCSLLIAQPGGSLEQHSLCGTFEALQQLRTLQAFWMRAVNYKMPKRKTKRIS